MTNAINVFFLLCAVFTCLALGVVFAYAACNAMFAAMRPSPRIAAAPDKAEVTA